MLRYFYLFCLLIYIKEIICYDHARSYKRLKSKHSGKYLRKFDNSHAHKDAHVIKRREGYGSHNENDFTLIDVASFIQKPDSYADDGRFVSQQYDFKGQFIPKHFTDYEELNKFYSNTDFKDDHLNVYENLKSNEDFVSVKDLNYLSDHYLEESTKKIKSNELRNDDDLNHIIYNNEIDLDDSIRNPYKKRSRQFLKFPFFFRKANCSSDTRNLNSTKNQQYTFDLDYSDTDSSYNFPQKGMNKRSSKENAETVKIKNDKRRFGDSILHNSRQYYQWLISDSDSKKKTKLTDKETNNKKEPSIIHSKTNQTTLSTNKLNNDNKKISRKKKKKVNKKIIVNKKKKRTA